MSAHHRRRLRKVGWEHALTAADASWAFGAEPPREGNAIEVLVDGEEAFPRMAEAIAGARSHVHIAGWCVTPEFVLSAGANPVILRDVLADAARRVPVRVLLWGGAPLPLYPLSRRVVRGIREELCKGSEIQCALDTHERPLHCHHEKLVIIDDELAFVGGIDLTDFAGNRLDRPGHPPRGSLGWHDVATVVRGPAVAAVAGISTCAGTRPRASCCPPRASRAAPVTRSCKSSAPCPSTSTRHCPRASSRSSRAMRAPCAPPSTSSTSRISSSGRRRSSRSSARSCATRPASASACCSCCPPSRTRAPTTPAGQLGLLADADDGAGRMLACTRYAVADGASDRVYVHAKVGIVDDRWLTVGSANLNEHSLFNDTEMNVVSHDPGLARATRLRLWAEHLAQPAETLEGDPATLIDEIWRPLASEQLERRAGGSRPDARTRGARARLAALQAPARAASEPARRRLSGRFRLRSVPAYTGVRHAYCVPDPGICTPRVLGRRSPARPLRSHTQGSGTQRACLPPQCASPAGAASKPGSSTRNVVPTPSSLSTPTVPWWVSAIALTIARPRPLPRVPSAVRAR